MPLAFEAGRRAEPADGGETGARPGQAFYLTVAIDYPNGDPHIGHAYEKVAADALARLERLRGRRVYYLMGTDEHSTNVVKEARARGLAPAEYCEAMARVFAAAWRRLGIGYDEFMRTGDPRHVQAVQSLVSRLHDQGHVYRGTYKGWYCVSCEAFKTEKELADGLCPVHRRPVDQVEETNWFFRLSAFRDAVLAHIERHEAFIRPEARRNEVLSFLREGLEDISISRARSEWGVPLPWDPDQVVYVWFDALITYLSGAGYGWDPGRFAALWPATVHLIGKDITRFHCVIWPAMLLAAGLPLPQSVYGHGFMNLRGDKLSKTTGNVIDPVRFCERYGTDATRYYLLAETPFGQDGNITPESFVKRYNSDLANDLGNLLSRSVAMIERFLGGVIPAPAPEAADGFDVAAAEAVARAAAAFRDFRSSEGLAALFALCARANKYIDTEAPWTLAQRGEAPRLCAVLYNVAEVLRILALALSPSIPTAAAEMLRQLGLPPGSLERARWADLAWGGLPAGLRVVKGTPLFVRLDPAAVLADPVFGAAPAAAKGGGRAPGEKLKGDGAMPTQSAHGPLGGGPAGAGPAVAAPGPEVGAPAPPVSLDEFRRLELRVGTVTHAEPVRGADRLLRLEVDLGPAGHRQIVSGIAQHYAVEAMIGRQVILVANLAPATIRGVRSEGMLLAASDEAGLRLIGPDAPVRPGSSAR